MSKSPVESVKKYVSNVTDSDTSFKILTDEVEKHPLLRFDEYKDVLFRLIVQSDPRFSIGIFGEWGTGKTTLMQLLAGELNNEVDILVVWFNAWKYERDRNLIVVSLLKSIIFGMEDSVLYKKLKRTIMGTIIDFDKGISGKFGLNEKTEDLFLKERNSIYFDGIKKIEHDLNLIRSSNPKCRIVVFIDDLDRCSPERAVEIFESIKGFLDIPGFIYVIGLSYETIAKFLSAIYRDVGISGENYIQKIIQIPIQIPLWNKKDIEKLVDKLSSRLGNKYSKFISENKQLIATGIQQNPRELKRFINNYVLSGEIIFNDRTNITPNTEIFKKYTNLLVVQIMRSRWSGFSRIFTDFKIKNQVINKIIDEDEPMREARLNHLKGSMDEECFKIILENIQNNELWEFLKLSKKVINGIDDWNRYLRPAEGSIELLEKLLKLVPSFNLLNLIVRPKPEDIVKSISNLPGWNSQLSDAIKKWADEKKDTSTVNKNKEQTA